MTNKKVISHAEWIQLLLGVAVIFGGIVRFFPGLMAGFPLNDGGMFLSMILDLKASAYVLPRFTSYNQLDIPFAYPPFGFYLARLLSDLLNVQELDILRWLPPFVHSISVFAFYRLASEMLRSKGRGALASAFYALTPGAFGWFIMGGGLTRSLGSFFLLLSVYFVLRLFQEGVGKFIGLAILFGGLTVLSHPEAGVHAAATCILVWLFFGRTVKSLWHACLVGAGVLLVTSPWWLTVISNHGLTPFLSALHTGSYGAPIWVVYWAGIFSVEGFFPLLAVLRVIGLGWGIWKKQYFLIAWSVLPFLAEPRSAPSVAFYPLTMLVALAFADAFPYFISKLRAVKSDLEELHQNNRFNAVLFLTLTYLFVYSGLYGFRLLGNSLKPNDVESMIWVKENTPPGATFLVYTGVESPEIDPFVEWFPALSGRGNISTIQGYEWLLAGDFYEFYGSLTDLQQCKALDCIENWSDREAVNYQYILIKSDADHPILKSMQGGNYAQVYSVDGIVIYEAPSP